MSKGFAKNQNQPDGGCICHLDTHGALIWANAQLLDMTVNEEEVLKGRPFVDLVISTDRPFVRELLDDFIRGDFEKLGTLEFAATLDSWPAYPIQWTLSCKKDFLALVGHPVSTTDRRNIPVETHYNKDAYRLKDFLESAPYMLHALDSSGRIELVSDRWLEKMGYTRDEVLGRQSIDFLTPPSQKKAEVLLNQLFQTGDYRDVEYQFVTKVGAILEVIVSAKVEKDQSGSIVRSIMFVTDMTDQRKMMRELKKREHLLEESNVALEQFAYRASHDLKSPLVSMRGFTELAQREIMRSRSEEALPHLKRVQSSIDHLTLFIDNIFRVMQVDHMEQDWQVVNLTHVMRALKEKMLHLHHGINLNMEVEVKHVAPLSVYKTSMELILENLMMNVMKYRKPSSKIVQVRLKTWEDRDRIVLSLTDNGLGIPKEYHGQVFQMFKRFHSGGIPGNGLGLYLVKKHVERLKGDITFNSSVGGTTFIIKLPITSIEKVAS